MKAIKAREDEESAAAAISMQSGDLSDLGIVDDPGSTSLDALVTSSVNPEVSRVESRPSSGWSGFADAKEEEEAVAETEYNLEEDPEGVEKTSLGDEDLMLNEADISGIIIPADSTETEEEAPTPGATSGNEANPAYVHGESEYFELLSD
jgi:hypothetical protein